MPVTAKDKRATFQKSSEAGCFVLPNPGWSAGATSDCSTWASRPSPPQRGTRGRSERRLSHHARRCLRTFTALCAAVDLPVKAIRGGASRNETGAGRSPTSRARFKTALQDGPIEDSTRDYRESALRGAFGVSGSRRRAQRSLTTTAARCWSAVAKVFGRAGGYHHGDRPAERPMRRAGADCLYAQVIKPEQISEVREGSASQPVNLLPLGSPGLAVDEAASSASRISVSGVRWRAQQGRFHAPAQGDPPRRGLHVNSAWHIRRRIEQDVQLDALKTKSQRATASRCAVGRYRRLFPALLAGRGVAAGGLSERFISVPDGRRRVAGALERARWCSLIGIGARGHSSRMPGMSGGGDVSECSESSGRSKKCRPD